MRRATEVSHDIVEDFILVNSLDEKCANALRGCDVSIQAEVIERGPLVDACTSPSAVVMSRINRAKYGEKPRDLPPGAPRKKTSICANFEQFGECKFGASCHFAHGELELGTMQTNPAQPNATQGGGKGMATSSMAGKGGKAYDEGFGKGYGGDYGGRSAGGVEAIGGMMGQMMQMMQGLKGGGQGANDGYYNGYSDEGSQNIGSSNQGPAPTQEELSEFIVANELDDKVAQQLVLEPPDIQRLVLDAGSLTSCTNPSAACAGRIRKLHEGGAARDQWDSKGGSKGSGGDGWGSGDVRNPQTEVIGSMLGMMGAMMEQVTGLIAQKGGGSKGAGMAGKGYGGKSSPVMGMKGGKGYSPY